MAALLALALVATSAALTQAGKSQILMVTSKTVNETVTAEATLEFLIKNYDDSGDLHGSLRIGLFGDRVPMTVLNFVSLCNGVKRPQVGVRSRLLSVCVCVCQRVCVPGVVLCGSPIRCCLNRIMRIVASRERRLPFVEFNCRP